PADDHGGPTGSPARGDPVPAPVRRIRAHETYRHECVLYARLDDFLTTMVPFIRDGLAREEPVMVAVAQPRLRALRSALGPDTDADVVLIGVHADSHVGQEAIDLVLGMHPS